MPPDQLETSWECWGHLETPVTSLLGVLLRGKDSAGLSTREAHSFKSIYSGKVWAVRQQVRLFLQRHSQHWMPGYIPGLPFKREGISNSNPPSLFNSKRPHKHRKISSRASANDCFLYGCAPGLVQHRCWSSPAESGQLSLLPPQNWHWRSVNFWGMKIL